MSRRGSVLLHVLVTGVMIALISATLLRMTMFRYQMAGRGAHTLIEKRDDTGRVGLHPRRLERQQQCLHRRSGGLERARGRQRRKLQLQLLTARLGLTAGRSISVTVIAERRRLPTCTITITSTPT